MVIVLLLALAAVFLSQSASAQSAYIWGVLCYTEEASGTMAEAHLEGGPALFDTVVEELIEAGKCVRIPDVHSAINGYFVYEGAVIGSKRVIGISPVPFGIPQFYGLVQADDPGPTPEPPLNPGGDA